MVFSADNLTLPDVFKLYDPPEIQTGRVQRSTPGASASTRAPSTVLGTIFSCLPNDTLSITHNPGILVSLSTLLNESWSDLSKHRVNGSEWDMKFTLDEHQASIAVIRGEVVDLAAVFESFLFQAVNYTASRQAALLKAEAYPSIAARTSWGPSVQGGGLRGADVSASLRRDGIHSVVREIDRVVMERKGPASLSMDIILGGIRTALAGGFKIRRRSDGTYLTHEDVDTSFMHALLQTFEYMNQRRTKVGVLTNYNVFLVILRTARNQITLSSPVLRDSNLRVGLEEGLANDMSVWALLLALLLYAGQPDKIEEKADIWKALWVRSPGEEQDKSTKKGRRSWGGGDGNERSKKTGAGDENWGGTPAETGPEDGTEKVQHRIRCGSTPNPNSSAGWSVEMQPKVPPPTDHTFSNQPSMDEGHISFLGLSPSPSVRLSHCTPLSNANLHFHQTSRNVSQQTLLWFEERRFHLTNPVPSLSNIEANPWLSLDELIAEGPHFTTFSASAPDCLSPDADDLASSCSTEPDTFSAGSSAETHVNLTQPPATIDPPPRQYILKLARLFSPPHHTELGLASGSDIVSALELELRCYTNHLADLQGSIVPRFHGLWLSQSPGGQWAILLLEKVGLGGKQMRKWEELTKGESDLVRCAYTALHTRGILHRDLEPRHIFFEPSSSPTPISSPTVAGTAESTNSSIPTPQSRALTPATSGSYSPAGMRVRIVDFDRAEIIANGTAKDGVEREVRELERLFRRRVGAEVQLRG